MHAFCAAEDLADSTRYTLNLVHSKHLYVLHSSTFYYRNEFNFRNVHGIMNTSGLFSLQETRSIHDSMNIPKIEFIASSHFIINI